MPRYWCLSSYGGGVTSLLNQYFIDKSWSLQGAFVKFYYLTVDYCNHLWFLFTLFFLNGFYPIIEKYISSEAVRHRLYLCGLLILLTCSQSYYLVGGINGLKGFQACSLAYAVLGVSILSQDVNIKKKKIAITVLVSSIVLQVLHNYMVSTYSFMQKLGNPSDLVFSGYSSLWVMLTTSSFMYSISWLNLKVNTFISFVSDNTLGIYLIHFVVIRALRCYTCLQQSPIILLLVTIVITLSLVYGMSRNKYFKKIITT